MSYHRSQVPGVAGAVGPTVTGFTVQLILLLLDVSIDIQSQAVYVVSLSVQGTFTNNCQLLFVCILYVLLAVLDTLLGVVVCLVSLHNFTNHKAEDVALHSTTDILLLSLGSILMCNQAVYVCQPHHISFH